jgi:UDP-glucose 4-epimerase
LLDAMARHGCKRIVFSSSATVYGQPESLPIPETAPLSPLNPYGRTKRMVEDILRDCRDLRACLLRYFNPVGAHDSGHIGEDPNDVPNNLMPYVMQVAVGRRPEIAVYGGDYATKDGTGVRDYIHVVDVAEGHLAALDTLDTFVTPEAINLGTGRGHSVLEVIAAASLAVGRALPHKIVARRAGDAAAVYADVAKAARVLGWRAKHDLAAMCTDAWRWQQQNPNGYA